MKDNNRETASAPEAMKQDAMELCQNRCVYAFDEDKEKAILARISERRQLPQLVSTVIAILNGTDGNLRVGAAELLGAITPASMQTAVIAALGKHADDPFVRDYAYAGTQGDEDDLRSVAECAKTSISQLRTAKPA
jgi:hypothetical protein